MPDVLCRGALAKADYDGDVTFGIMLPGGEMAMTAEPSKAITSVARDRHVRGFRRRCVPGRPARRTGFRSSSIVRLYARGGVVDALAPGARVRPESPPRSGCRRSGRQARSQAYGLRRF